MKVIVVAEIENVAYEETFGAKVGTTDFTMTDMLYHAFTTILGVYSSADAARKALENERMELMKKYGEKALDDENIEDNHTFYTFATKVLELEGVDENVKAIKELKKSGLFTDQQIQELYEDQMRKDGDEK